MTLVYILMALLVIIVTGLLGCLVYFGSKESEKVYDRVD